MGWCRHFFGLFFLSGVYFVESKYRVPVFAIMLFPAMDITSDLVYIIANPCVNSLMFAFRASHVDDIDGYHAHQYREDNPATGVHNPSKMPRRCSLGNGAIRFRYLRLTPSNLVSRVGFEPTSPLRLI